MSHIDTLIQSMIQEQIQENASYFGKDNYDYGEEGELGYDHYVSLLSPWNTSHEGRKSVEECSDARYFVEEVQAYLDDDESPIDECGFVSQHIKNMDLSKCWHRCYWEPEWDNFRCEILTDPTDSFVVLMSFIED